MIQSTHACCGNGSGSSTNVFFNYPPTACNIPMTMVAGTLWTDTSVTPSVTYYITNPGTGNCDATFTTLTNIPIGCVPQICDNDADTTVSVIPGGGDPDTIQFMNNGIASGYINQDGTWSVGNILPDPQYQLTVGGSVQIIQDAPTQSSCWDESIKVVRGTLGDSAGVFIGNQTGGFSMSANENVHILSSKCPNDVFLKFTAIGVPITGPLSRTFTLPDYPSLRDNALYSTPVNFLYTNNSGELLSAPTSVITDNVKCLNAVDKTGGPCMSLCVRCSGLVLNNTANDVFSVNKNGEVFLIAYPESRNDGCSDSFLTTDTTGNVLKKTVKKGWDDMGTISAMPTALVPNACKAIYRWRVDTSAGNIDFTSIPVLTNISHGDTLCFTNMGPNSITYTDPYSGFTYVIDQADVLTLTYDDTYGYAIEVG